MGSTKACSRARRGEGLGSKSRPRAGGGRAARKEGGRWGRGDTDTPQSRTLAGARVMKETGEGRNGDPGSRDKKLKAEREEQTPRDRSQRPRQTEPRQGHTDQGHEHVGNRSAPDARHQETTAHPRCPAPGNRSAPQTPGTRKPQRAPDARHQASRRPGDWGSPGI